MTLQASSQKQLRQFIEQIESLEEQKAATSADIRDTYAAAKAEGFDPKIMKKIVARRKREQAELDEEDMLMDTYWRAVQVEFDFGDKAA